MTNVQFDSDEESGAFRLHPISPPKGLYQFFIKMGVAKDNEEAGKVMLVIAVCAVIIGVVYPFLFG